MVTPEERNAWRRLASSADLSNRQIALEILRAQPKFWVNEILTWMLWHQQLCHPLVEMALWEMLSERLFLTLKQNTLGPFEKAPLDTLQMCRVHPHFQNAPDWLSRWAIIRLERAQLPFEQPFFKKAFRRLRQETWTSSLKIKRAFKGLDAPIKPSDAELRLQSLKGAELVAVLQSDLETHQDICLAQFLYQQNTAHRKLFYDMLNEKSKAQLRDMLAEANRLEIAQLPYEESLWTKTIYHCAYPYVQQTAMKMWCEDPKIHFNVAFQDTSKTQLADQKLRDDYNNLVVKMINEQRHSNFRKSLSESLGNIFLGLYYDMVRREDI